MRFAVFLAVLLFWLGVVCVTVAFTGCAPAPKHQKGGVSSQKMPVMPSPPAAFSQSLAQPENAAGPAEQSLDRTVTVTRPDGTVTVTHETARTALSGSQDMAGIIRQYLFGEYFRRILACLVLCVIAWKVRREWPLAAGVLAIGAGVTALYGEGWALAAAVLALALFVAWHVIAPKLPIP